MIIYTLTELKEIIDDFLKRTKVMRPDLYKIFLLQRETACRIGEAVDYTRWRITDHYIRLHPQKRNNDRIFELEDFSEITMEYLENQMQHFPTKYYNKVNYYMKEYLSIPLRIKEKRVTTHIFRHIKAKELKQELGATDLQIQDYLGEKTLKSAQAYIYSEIYTK